MLTRVHIRPIAFAAAVMLFTLSGARASELTVRIVDRTGRPVEQVIVIVESLQNSTAGRRALQESKNAAESVPAIVDQKNQQFLPHVTVVRTGTEVLFPNSDSIAHQVYSFSPAKRFELGLYRGHPHPPVTFDKPGIVVLGCNIHDSMIGYVYVTDAPYFGSSDELGEWQSHELSAGTYRVSLWSPRLSKGESEPSQTISIETESRQLVTFRLSQPLRSVPGQQKEPRARDY